MRSASFRQFSLTAGMILLSFLLLGFSFTSLFYSYLVRQEKNALSTNAEAVVSYVSAQPDLDSFSGWDTQLTISYGAGVSDTDVLLCNTSGQITLCSCNQFICDHLGKYIPMDLVQQATNTGIAYGSGTLDGIYEENRYLCVMPIFSAESGELMGYVLVSSITQDTSAVLVSIIWLFLMTAVVVLLIALAATGIISRRQTQTIRSMSNAARQFAHGDFSTRIHAYDADTEISDLANAFNNMAASLERSESLRQEFISNVSHELKTPMTTIAGFMDGMLDGTIPPEKYRYYMETVSAEVKRLSRMVRSMLDISRLQSTGEEIQKSRFDVTEVLGRTLLTFEQKIEAKHLDVQVDMPEKAVYVMANEDAITQVIYNLIDNGVKFSAQETPFLLKVAVSGSKALISVANTGPTIPPEELALIFDRFHKSDKSRSEDTSGVGLGLYIVKTILGSHGEDISVTSRDGLTTFTFTLALTK